MILRGEKCVFLSLLVHFLAVLLQCVNPCVGQNVMLSTRSEVVVFEGERVTLLCSVSDTQTDQTPTLKITYENGTVILAGEIAVNNIPTVQSVPVQIKRIETFFCTVDWESFHAVANLSISPLPNELTHCASNYINGIIVDQTLTLTCASVTSRTSYLKWSSNGNESISIKKDNERTMTLFNTINVQPFESQNGSIFTCERSNVQSDLQDRCTVGPIYVYDDLLVFINPVTSTNRSKIHPGESRKYICSSLSNSSIRWIIPDIHESSGIELSVVGATIDVTVSADSTFTGQIELNCSANIGDVVAVGTLTLEIKEKATTPTLEVSETSKTTPEFTETDATADLVLFIVIGAVGGILVILLIIVISVLVCLNCQSNKGSTIKPDSKKPADFTEREYADPPFGFVQPDGTQEVHVDIHSDPEQDSQLLYSEIDKGGLRKEIRQSDSGALLPPTSIKQEATVSQHKGQENGGFTTADEVKTDSQFEEQDYSMISRDRVSVVYSAPNKKSRVRSTSVSPNDDREEEDSSAIPTYSEVKKERHVVIEEDQIDDDLDDEYWNHQQ